MGYCNFVGYVVRNCGILKHLGVGDGWYLQDNPTGTYEPGFVHDFRSWDDLPSRYKYLIHKWYRKSEIPHLQDGFPILKPPFLWDFHGFPPVFWMISQPSPRRPFRWVSAALPPAPPRPPWSAARCE